MSYEAAWGFDPEKALRAQLSFQAKSNFTGDEEAPCDEEARIPIFCFPKTAVAQVYELRRMFRL